MSPYNTLNIKLSNAKLNTLTSGIQNGTEVTLNLSSNMVRNSNDGTNFPHKLLLFNGQISRLCKAFINGLSANIKLSKTQLHQIAQSGGFLDRLLGQLLKPGFTLIRNVLKPLAKIVLCH